MSEINLVCHIRNSQFAGSFSTSLTVSLACLMEMSSLTGNLIVILEKLDVLWPMLHIPILVFFLGVNAFKPFFQ